MLGIFIATDQYDPRPAPLPMGNGRAMIGQSNWQFSKNDFWGFSSISGLDCTNNSSKGKTIPTFLKSVRDPISGMAA